jgi:RNase P subunit RPR2
MLRCWKCRKLITGTDIAAPDAETGERKAVIVTRCNCGAQYKVVIERILDAPRWDPTPITESDLDKVKLWRGDD